MSSGEGTTNAAAAGGDVPATSGEKARPQRYRMPAEWEPHGATWLAWPHDPETWPGILGQIPPVWGALVEAVRGGENVCILSRDTAMDEEIAATLGGDLAGVEVFRVSTQDVWIRDYGPTFVRDLAAPPGSSDLALVDWGFNAWGGKYPSLTLDARVPLCIAGLTGLERVPGGMVLEGGSIDVDGEGTLLTTESCLLHPRRNPELDRAGIERRLMDRLGVRLVIWLGEGIEGDDTDGHIDDLTRFVAPGVVVTASESREDDANFRPLRANLERLRAERDAAGRRLEVVELPMPDPVVHLLPDGSRQRSPASYANFYVANEAVLVPTYRSSTDELALGLLGELFPGRRVVGVDCHDVVLGMGSIHCVTQQQPAVRRQ